LEFRSLQVEAIGQFFRLGIWDVKPENALEFIDAWQTSGEWLVQHLPGEKGAVLLQDTSEPSRFISFAPLSDPQKAVEAMSKTEFQKLWSRVMALCEAVEPNSMRVVGSVGGKVES
jgi:hypothetical protein